MAVRAMAVTLLALGMTTMPKWTAILQPSGDSIVSGSAVVEAMSRDSTRASIQLAGARPGSGLAWQIQSGGCEADGEVLGERSDYPMLRVGTDGKATGAVTLAAGLPSTGQFSVTVRKHSHEAEPAACGRLTATGRAAPDNPTAPQP